ncbi:serine/threonine-protein kinase [Nocardia sp. NPDC050712]|uniref:WD40 repeat domain-containing serine/threonine protein kinase n=1 Tax=Nocardia sp. NPDC050712 TaxID=3155518 RepID=UPI0033D7B7BD
MRLASGTVVGGYVVDRLLGAGGMGAVYLARHPRMDRQVALKILEELSDTDAKMRRNFAREATLAASLDHPNIVPVYDHSRPDEPRLWIAMKYVAGQDASVLLRQQGPLALTRAAQLISDIAAGLDYAHRAGVLHRDVKPANMLVEVGADGRERALVTDFGIARAVDHTVTMSGIMASFAYTAPERFLGLAADQRADVYSLGCSLYELLTGCTPFKYAEQSTMVAAHLTAEPPRCTGARPDLPGGLDKVIARALAKRPDDRFARCGELAAQVSELARSQHASTVRARQTTSPQQVGRRQLLIGAGVLAPIATVGAAIPFLLRDNLSSPNSATQPATPTAPFTYRNVLDTPIMVTHCSFNRDGTQVAGYKRIWDVRTRRITDEFSHPVLAWSSDGAYVALENSGAPVTRTSDRGPIGATLAGDDNDQEVAAFSPDGALLATGGRGAGTGHAVRLWSPSTGQPAGRLTGHSDRVRAIAFKPNSTLLATGGDDQTVRLWDVKTRRPVGLPLGHRAAVLSLAFSPDGETLAVVAGYDLQLWRLDGRAPDITATEVEYLEDSRSSSYRAATFSPDGSALVAVGDKMRLWDTRTWKPIGPAVKELGRRSVAASPDGTLLAAGGDFGVTMWTLTLPE